MPTAFNLAEQFQIPVIVLTEKQNRRGALTQVRTIWTGRDRGAGSLSRIPTSEIA